MEFSTAPSTFFEKKNRGKQLIFDRINDQILFFKITHTKLKDHPIQLYLQE